jgi:hypothetical protein
LTALNHRIGSATDIYVDLFLARREILRGPGQPNLDEPGVCGLLASPDDPRIRLLVTDDKAEHVHSELMGDAMTRTVRKKCWMRPTMGW